MSFLLEYLLKLSVSLAIVYLFYQLLLRRLTFYDHNRWYLLGYTLLSFLIPFIDISPVLEKNEWTETGIVTWVPTIDTSTHTAITNENSFTLTDLLITAVLSGMVIMLVRLFIQVLSFRQMRKKAIELDSRNMKVYQVNERIIPFSFGNSIFINRHLHSAGELQEIIRHEIVHVKQKHSIDILWAEILCLINWFNPFAWLLKRAIRQNLEFIADNKVLENGINKKEYQYLLLKVIGNHQYSIATAFNFSSLKKRIAMMNKLRSARVNLLRFLFVLPLLAVILVSFRKQIGETFTGGKQALPPAITDTVPEVRHLNSKGYYIDIKDKDGTCEVLVRDENKKEIRRILLTDWNKEEARFTDLYGEILPPPSPKGGIPAPPQSNTMKDFLKRNPAVKSVGWVYDRENEIAVVHLNKMDGTSEQIDVRDEKQVKKAEEKYGELPIVAAPPIPPLPPTAPAPATPPPPGGYDDPISRVSNEFEITDKKAVIKLKNGIVEKYDLTDKKERADFESKYGRIITSGTPADITAPVVVLGGDMSATIAPAPVVSGDLGITTADITPKIARGVYATTPAPPVSGNIVTTVIGDVLAATPVLSTAPMGGVAVIDDEGYMITGKEDIVVKITKHTTRKELDGFIQQMKAKDIELSYDDIQFNDKGQLVVLTGTMTSKDGSKSRFVASDFEFLILAMIKKSDRTFFKVSTQDKKEVI